MLLPIARWRHFALLALLALPLARGPIRAIRTNASGRGLIPALAGTGTLLLGTGALLALGIAI
jgi:1,4-dihydroxy-2-naphthoate octaprenyltransferase